MTAPAITDLAECEAIIERGLTTFVDVGSALLRIRDERLYRRDYATFESYCRERWGFADSRARQLIAAAQTVTTVTAAGAPAPTSERQARELAGLDMETAADVMRHAESIGDGKVTAALIREARQQVTEPPIDVCPMCGNDLDGGNVCENCYPPADDPIEAIHALPDFPEDDDSDWDDEPALTEAECEALADPEDLDEPGPRITGVDGKSYPARTGRSITDAIDARNPDAKADRERATLKAAYSKAMKGVAELPLLDVEAVASVLTDTEANVMAGVVKSLSRWAERVSGARRRTGLQIIEGGAQ